MIPGADRRSQKNIDKSVEWKCGLASDARSTVVSDGASGAVVGGVELLMVSKEACASQKCWRDQAKNKKYDLYDVI